MAKTSFIRILEDSEILAPPDDKVDPMFGKYEEAKENEDAYSKKDVMEAIKECGTFDKNYLGFVDFLEALTCFALDFPFTQE